MTGTAAATSPVADPIDPNAAAVVQPDAQAATESTPDANAADPSTVDADAKKPDLLSVVKAAVEKPAEPVASSDPEGDPVDPAAEGAAVADPAAEDDADLPFHNHPRWQQVIAERDALRDPAERYGHITQFMDQHGLTSEEVAEGYEVMALLKSGDPTHLAKARDWFSERLDALDGMLGNSLPEDLRQRVEDGLLDEAGAQELAQARATAALHESQVTARTVADEETRTRAAQENITRSMVTAVEDWEARVKAADPDYSKKADLVQAKCAAIAQRTGQVPTTPAEATALADQALAEVNALFKSALPKPRPITPAPNGQSTVIVAQPKTLRDAINAAVGH